MKEIKKSLGLNESEKYLSEIAEKTFLSLWAYPNVYRQPGTELADLLVVHGNNIIIFSDKDIGWSEGADTLVAWRRWYKRALLAGANSVSGAAKWISDHPSRVYLDAANRDSLPFDLSRIENPIFHLVSVCSGAEFSVKKHFNDRSGTLILMPHLKGKDHTDGYLGKDVLPFCVGDILPDRKFVHVMTRSGLECVLEEMSTITDFVNYLNWREIGFRKHKFLSASGEEELVAANWKGLGDSCWDLVKVYGKAAKGRSISFTSGLYFELTTDPNYLEWKMACAESYFWDSLIEEFSKHVISGAVPVVAGHAPSFSASESVLRFMASESRERRIFLSQSLRGMLQRSIEDRAERYVRKIPKFRASDTHGYVFMVSTYHSDLDSNYKSYRDARAVALGAYCLDLLWRFPDLEHAIGIAMDTHPSVSGKLGSSEDVILVERPEFDQDLLNYLEEMRSQLEMQSIDVRTLNTKLKSQEARFRAHRVKSFAGRRRYFRP